MNPRMQMIEILKSIILKGLGFIVYDDCIFIKDKMYVVNFYDGERISVIDNNGITKGTFQEIQTYIDKNWQGVNIEN